MDILLYIFSKSVKWITMIPFAQFFYILTKILAIFFRLFGSLCIYRSYIIIMRLNAFFNIIRLQMVRALANFESTSALAQMSR